MNAKKQIAAFALAMVMLLACTPIANAANVAAPVDNAVDSSSDIQPLLDETIPVYLSYENSSMTDPAGWYTLVSDNNLFRAKVKLTSDVANVGEVYFRVINADGEVICKPIQVSPGTYKTSDMIYAFAGRYTVQVKLATDHSGTYSFTVTDIPG